MVKIPTILHRKAGMLDVAIQGKWTLMDLDKSRYHMYDVVEKVFMAQIICNLCPTTDILKLLTTQNRA
jgi:hypothetical protein